MAQGVAEVTRSIGRVAGAGTGWLLRRRRRPGVVDQRAAATPKVMIYDGWYVAA